VTLGPVRVMGAGVAVKVLVKKVLYNVLLVCMFYKSSVIRCPELNDIPNGDLRCLIKGIHEYFVGDNCTYICNTGYELTGSDTRTCQSNGSWSGSDDVCRRGILNMLNCLRYWGHVN